MVIDVKQVGGGGRQNTKKNKNDKRMKFCILHEKTAYD